MKKVKKLFATPKMTAITIICIVSVLAVLGIGTVFAASAVAQSTSIGDDNARNFAFADAGVDPVSAENIRSEFDFEQGQFVYEVEFVSDGTQYEYWIKASDGSVVKKEVEIINADGNNVKVSASITADEAKEIAITDAGLSFSDVTFVKEKLDMDDNISVYDIEFHTDDTEYEYEINANTGDIYSRSKEPFTPNTDTNGNTQNNQPLISLEDAKNTALADAGVSAADATFTKAKQDTDDGAAVYDIEFYTAAYEYDYEIDAATGAVLSRESEPLKASGNSGTSNQQGNNGSQENNDSQENNGNQDNNGQQSGSQGQTPSSKISLEDAKNKALADAGVSAADATFTKAKQDMEHGSAVYDIEFYTATHEYDYEIDAVTGAVLSRESEPLKTTGNSSNDGDTSDNGESYIGIEQAKSIAVSHAGFSISDVTFSKAKLDHDDGYRVYEIEFYKDGVEYEYEINAATGEIIDFDSEYDD